VLCSDQFAEELRRRAALDEFLLEVRTWQTLLATSSDAV
jgi:hypothetical protein